jgi:hypothetical protein
MPVINTVLKRNIFKKWNRNGDLYLKNIIIPFRKISKLPMNKHFLKFSLLLLLFAAQNSIISAQETWKLESQKDGITIYSKSSEGSAFKSFKAHMLIKGSVNTFVAILQDIDNMKDWGYSIKSTQLLERKGDTLQIYYAEASAPFPFENRDGVYLNKFRWDTKSKQLNVDIELLPDYIKKKNKLVRVKGKGFWIVKVLKNDMLDITFSMQVDPGGNIPAWMVNIMVDTTPYTTMTELKKVMGNKKYQSKRYGFIKL